MRYLHAMVRVRDLDASLRFFRDGLGLVEIRRRDYPEAEVELTWNYDDEDYGDARNFGHLAFEVDDIHVTCAHLVAQGVTINRPPRDGRMAFVRSPDGISIELLQRGEALAPSEPWVSMENTGRW